MVLVIFWMPAKYLWASFGVLPNSSVQPLASCDDRSVVWELLEQSVGLIGEVTRGEHVALRIRIVLIVFAHRDDNGLAPRTSDVTESSKQFCKGGLNNFITLPRRAANARRLGRPLSEQSQTNTANNNV